MNILAEKQLQLFRTDISEEERAQLTDTFYELYFQLRTKAENSFTGRLSLKTRRKLHGFVWLVYTIKNHLGKFSYEIINDGRVKTDRPIIYAITHVGKFDIEVLTEAIRDHYYLLSGDYEHIQGTIDASFLQLNGAIYFNEYVKSDRARASNRMIEYLKSGGTLMYFPEGTWNISPNLPVLPCYWGIVQIAQQSNAIIIPIAADQYGKHFKINIGQPFDMQQFGVSTEEKTKAITSLRDIMATLKWEIWETEKASRSKISGDEWEQYTARRFQEWPYFSSEYIGRLVFKPKNVTEYFDAFDHLQSIRPNQRNAFLLNKRLK